MPPTSHSRATTKTMFFCKTFAVFILYLYNCYRAKSYSVNDLDYVLFNTVHFMQTETYLSYSLFELYYKCFCTQFDINLKALTIVFHQRCTAVNCSQGDLKVCLFGWYKDPCHLLISEQHSCQSSVISHPRATSGGVRWGEVPAGQQAADPMSPLC